jgi:hypothetical protein
MTEENKHMLEVEGHQAVAWEHFRDYIQASGEMKFRVVEQKRYEECAVAPGPDSDVIVAVVLIAWTETLTRTLKVSGKEDWPIAHTGLALGALFKTIPARSEVIVLLESDDVATTLIECEFMEQHSFDPIKHTNPPQWRDMLSTSKNKGIRWVHRKIGEEQNADLVKMRMIAIQEAQETMERVVGERYHTLTFLAWAIKRREAAGLSMSQVRRRRRRIRREREADTVWFSPILQLRVLRHSMMRHR